MTKEHHYRFTIRLYTPRLILEGPFHPFLTLGTPTKDQNIKNIPIGSKYLKYKNILFSAVHCIFCSHEAVYFSSHSNLYLNIYDEKECMFFIRWLILQGILSDIDELHVETYFFVCKHKHMLSKEFHMTNFGLLYPLLPMGIFYFISEF